MFAPWVVKAALVTIVTALATEGVKWAFERLGDKLKKEAEPQQGSENEK